MSNNLAPVPLAPSDFLADALERPGDADVIAALVADLAPIAPAAAVRAAVLDHTRGAGRLHRFADKLAALIDVGLDKARELLDRAADAAGWERDLVPGVDALWVEGGPAVAQCIRGFARVGAGAAFPDHAHLGDETTLVLEGAMIDADGTVTRPGELHHMTRGSQHHYRAAPGRTDLLFFVVVRDGITIAGSDPLRHRDGPTDQ